MNKRKNGLVEKASTLVNYSLVAIVRIYQIFISPLIGQRCRFYPSCSQYAIEAIERHPLHHALLLITKRLSKCHPGHEGGIDPVPEPKKTRL
ncbi:MAG: membrane protein insertion efficiency factor YidD [Kangiellaceae bacterium]|nr:membrane protein insertion efficiency factor YidD [Kangiellaceae bacterium]